jgi:hypothetical protein
MPDSAGGMMSEKVNMSDFFLLAVWSLNGYYVHVGLYPIGNVISEKK